MPKTFACPFWSWEEGRKMHCDAAVLRFKSAHTRTAYIDRYCAHVKGWESCPMADDLFRRYPASCPRGGGCGTLGERDAET